NKTSRDRSSLCNLCVLCASVVNFCDGLVNHRDTENTEVAQRNHSREELGSFRFGRRFSLRLFDRFDSALLYKRNQATASIPNALRVFPRRIGFNCRTVFHLDDCMLATSQIPGCSGCDWTIVERCRWRSCGRRRWTRTCFFFRRTLSWARRCGDLIVRRHERHLARFNRSSFLCLRGASILFEIVLAAGQDEEHVQ